MPVRSAIRTGTTKSRYVYGRLWSGEKTVYATLPARTSNSASSTRERQVRPLSASLRATSTSGATVRIPRPSHAQYSAQCSRSDPPWSRVMAVPPRSDAPSAAAPGATMMNSRAAAGESMRDAAAPAMRIRTSAAIAGSSTSEAASTPASAGLAPEER